MIVQMNRNKFNKVIEEFVAISPSDKLLFGSDAPISNQKSYLEVAKAYNILDNYKKVFKDI